MKVDIYISMSWEGRITCGKGRYGIVLQVMINGSTVTKEHYGAMKNLTKQKLAVIAVTDAIQYMTEKAEVVIHFDNKYVVNAIEEKNPGTAYQELWSTFFDACEDMESVNAFDGWHEYESYLQSMMKKDKTIMMDDRRNQYV